jgi:hypothetical protein
MENNQVEVVRATQYHVDLIAPRLRQADRDEVFASSGRPVEEAVQESFESTGRTWAVELKEEPMMLFGVASYSALHYEGIPWMLATDRIHEVARVFLRESRSWVFRMAEGFARLENWIDVRNAVSIRWLKWCGFTMEEAEPYGPFGLPFHRFWLKREELTHV